MEIPAYRRISIRKAPGAPSDVVSFESLAHQASRGNVHHRALLDDLIRLGMVSQKDGTFELKADGLTLAEADRIHRLARLRWTALHCTTNGCGN